jgi:hypothetical protein
VYLLLSSAWLPSLKRQVHPFYPRIPTQAKSHELNCAALCLLSPLTKQAGLCDWLSSDIQGSESPISVKIADGLPDEAMDLFAIEYPVFQ